MESNEHANNATDCDSKELGMEYGMMSKRLSLIRQRLPKRRTQQGLY